MDIRDGLVAAWKMQETSGTRSNEIRGTATALSISMFHSSYAGPTSGYNTDLYEIHGSLNGEAGHIGNAARPVIDGLDRDYRTYGEWLRSPAYVNWYPLGPSANPLSETETPVNGTVAVLFKPETGIAATGGHTVGGLASYNSSPYPVLLVGTYYDGATLKVWARTTGYPSGVYSTPGVACAIDQWHIAFAWIDSSDDTLNLQLDGGTVSSVSIPAAGVEYGNFTYWQSGPRFTGLIDTSLLYDRVLLADERTDILRRLFVRATDFNYGPVSGGTGLSSTDLALLSARVGTLRLGAGRLGFFPWDVKGATNDEPGEYIWDEVKPPTTQWELQPGCEGWVCGFRPVAAFTDLPDPSEEDEVVQFTDASTPASEIKTWSWDFGDGGTSTDQDPTHTYTTAGTYTVTLTVTSDKGTDSATGTHTVTSLGTITGICYQNPDVPAPGQTVELSVDGTPFDTQVSDALDASYTFTDVPAGEITLSCTAVAPLGGYSGTAGPLTLAAGGSEVLDIILYSS